MPDDFHRASDVDRESIDIARDRAIFHWMRVFGVTEDQLIAAVRQVGSRPEDVRRALAR